MQKILSLTCHVAGRLARHVAQLIVVLTAPLNTPYLLSFRRFPRNSGSLKVVLGSLEVHFGEGAPGA
jgi:hypothetical protein